jgi:hypothetical protein
MGTGTDPKPEERRSKLNEQQLKKLKEQQANGRK